MLIMRRIVVDSMLIRNVTHAYISLSTTDHLVAVHPSGQEGFPCV